MTLIQVKIPDDNTLLIIELLQKLGCEVEQKKSEGKITKNKLASEKKVSPTYLFGKWTDFDMDARELREKAWSRKK